MEERRTLKLYDYYLVSYFPVFLAIIFELFISIVSVDSYIDGLVSSQYFSIHWIIRIVIFLLIARNIVYRLDGPGLDGVKTGMLAGLFLGLFFGLFSFFYEPTLGAFFYFLALPWQTVIAGLVITGGATFLLSQYSHEQSKLNE